MGGLDWIFLKLSKKIWRGEKIIYKRESNSFVLAAWGMYLSQRSKKGESKRNRKKKSRPRAR